MICYLVLAGRQPEASEAGCSAQSMSLKTPQTLVETHQHRERPPWDSRRSSRDPYSGQRRWESGASRPLSDDSRDLYARTEEIDSWLSSPVVVADKTPAPSSQMATLNSPASSEMPLNWSTSNTMANSFQHRGSSETFLLALNTISRPASQVLSFNI